MNYLQQTKLLFLQIAQTLTLMISGFVPQKISIKKYIWNIIKVKAWVCPYCGKSNKDKLFLHDFTHDGVHNFSCARNGNLFINIYNKTKFDNQLAYQFHLNLDQKEMFWEIVAYVNGGFENIKTVPQDKLKSRKDFDRIIKSIELLR